MSNLELGSELCFRIGATIAALGLLVSFTLIVCTETFGTDYHLVAIGLPFVLGGLILVVISGLIELWSNR